MGPYIKKAQKGKHFTLTEKGYNNTPDHVKHERKIGEPIKGFETRVYASWIEQGYVEQTEKLQSEAEVGD